MAEAAGESIKPKGQAGWLAQRLESYCGVTGCFDEAVEADGAVRPAWKRMFNYVGRLTQEEIQLRSTQAQRQIENDGAVFNPHDMGEVSRPWKLDPIPLIIAQQEWSQVAEGLQQRAQLANLLLLDLLGPQTLLHEKVVPPELLYANPNYFPAYHGLVQHPRQHIHLYAADLARGPGGRWWVTTDRTRAPSGLGFVLENRLITSRLMPSVFAGCNALRLASFFQSFKESLAGWSDRFRENPRIAIWSKGPTSKSYFEDAFLARYLGHTLVEGDDIAVRQGRVMLKTLGGLLPIEVLLRRTEDYNCDSAELRSGTVHGVSGLLDVIRAGDVAVANSLGSSYAESPMLAAYLQGVCRHFFNEDLLLPSIATWWCGSANGLKYVSDNFERLVIRRAFRGDDDAPVFPRDLDARQRENLLAEIRQSPHQYVGQEDFSRSTTPVWENQTIEPWYLAIRGFSTASVGGGYTTLPGALARVSPDPNVLSQDMTSGEKSQDVWIAADQRVPVVTLLPKPSKQTSLQRSGADLPSRVAENLYWLGRNLERAEQSARLLRLALTRATSEDTLEDEATRLAELCDASGQLAPAPKDAEDEATDEPEDAELLSENASHSGSFVRRLVQGAFDPARPLSLRSTVAITLQTASKVRDRIALDSYRIVVDLGDQICRDMPVETLEGAIELVQVLDGAIDSLSAISGLASESMTRTLGWRFLDLGRAIERACQLVASTTVLFDKQLDDSSAVLEDCLNLCDSYMTYRSRYMADLDLAAVLDLIIADETNPRSLISLSQRILTHVEELPRAANNASLSQDQRIALDIFHRIRLADIFKLATASPERTYPELVELLHGLSDQLPTLSDCLAGRFLIHAGVFQRHFSRDSAALRQQGLVQPE